MGGVHIGQPLSRERINRDADAVVTAEGKTGVRANASACPVLRGRRPWHVCTLLDRKPGDLNLGRALVERPATGRRRAEAGDARGWRSQTPATSSSEASERGRATGGGVCGGRGRGPRRTRNRTARPGHRAPARRVPRPRTRTANCKAEEGGTVHRAPAPRRWRSTPGSLLRAQARGGSWRRWRDVGGLRP